MKKIQKRWLCPLAALLASTAAGAATIAGDTFEFSAVIDSTAVGPFSGVAGAVADGIRSSPDITQDVDINFTTHQIAVNWIDADSFDLLINSFGAIDLFDTPFTLAGLDFKQGSQSRAIVGAGFNRAASDVDSFEAGPQMPDPFVSFTASSVTASFSFIPAALAADGPILRFDVTPAIPEPGSVALLLAGLGTLGLVRRRAARRAAGAS